MESPKVKEHNSHLDCIVIKLHFPADLNKTFIKRTKSKKEYSLHFKKFKILDFLVSNI